MGSALPWPAMSGRRAVHRLEHARVAALGVDVAAGGEPDAAGDGRGDVGDDVAEEVVGDDDVEAARVGGEEDRRGVDVLVGGLDVGELGADLLDRAPPQVAGVGEDVVLVHEGQVPARAGLGAGEGVAHDALDAEAGVDADLGGDLVRGAGAQRAAVADVGPLGALADDDEVDAVRARPARRRAGCSTPGVELGRAQVDVVLQGEAQRAAARRARARRSGRSGRRSRRAGSRRAASTSSSTESGRVSPVACHRRAPRSYSVVVTLGPARADRPPRAP